ncbi:MAG: ferritin-like domain-containing protein [Proteobacteria bacterium]|nr:ferritin-like domain-containing protein [Pseudomonadota bacterium]
MSTNWETADILKCPMEICWQFDYEIDIQKLRNLYSKSKRAQWDAELDIDWDQEIDPGKPIVDNGRFAYDRIPLFQKLSSSQRETFTAHSAAHLLSQFLHGEQGALMTSAALTHAVPDYEGKLYAASQTMDEARHVEVYERFIRKLAIVYPISPWLKEIIDVTLQADHWVKIAIGMNMVVEGLALGAFHNMRRATTCELLRQITENVLRDESRHVAFGNVYLTETIRDLHADDREDMAQFAFEAVKMMSDSTGGPNGDRPPKPDPGFLKVLETVGIDPGDFIASIQDARLSGVLAEVPPGQIHSFRDLMMPALVRVGAVTDRTRELFKAAEIPVFDDLTTLESMEDAETGDLSPV